MNLTVNGIAHEIESAPLTTLLDVLREELGVKSPKAGCEQGGCGACTVLVDGEPLSGCLTLAGMVEGREVTTVEGLGGGDGVQRAFVEAHAFQCGWCTAGFVLTAKALLDENPDPSEEEIVEARGGPLCRCGSYVKIVDAVRRAAAAGAGLR